MKSLYVFFVSILITNMAFSQLVFEEGFENGNTDGLPPIGWYCGETPKWHAGFSDQSHNRSAYTGNWYAYLPWSSDHWMFREITLNQGVQYELSMWLKSDGSDGFQYEIKLGNDTTALAMTNEIQPLVTINNTDYQQLIKTFVASQSGTFYIGIHGISDNNPWYLVIDDVRLRVVQDYNFELSRLSDDTIAYAGSYYDYKVHIKNIGLNDDAYDLTFTSEWDVDFYDKNGQGQISSIALDSYEADTFIVRQYVPATGVQTGDTEETSVSIASQNSTNTQSFQIITTAVSPILSFPYLQGFENASILPIGWSSTILSGSYRFEPVTEGQTPNCLPHDNSAAMVYYKSFSAISGSAALLSSPPIALDDSEFIVRFWVYRTDDIDNKQDKLEIYLADDASLTNPQLLGTIHRAINFEPVESQNGWFEYAFTFSAPESVKCIVFKSVSDYGWNMFVDDVKIAHNTPDLEAPEFISISGSVAYADRPIPIEVVIRDESMVDSIMQGVYDVGSGEVEFDMVLAVDAKGDYCYTGQVPAQVNGTTGTVWFIMEDVLGNSAETDHFPLSWSGIAPLLEESFEGEFPPADWLIMNEPYTWLIWSQVGTEQYEDSDENTFTVVPPHGVKQAMVGWDFQENHQDEWLISAETEITAPADLSFETFAQYGSLWYDHFTVGISTNGISWDVVWDASDLPTTINQYQDKVIIPLDDYVGQNIRVAWRAYNTVYENFWYAWFIDNVKIEKRNTIGLMENEKQLPFTFDILKNPIDDQLSIRVQNSEAEEISVEIHSVGGQLFSQQAISLGTSSEQVVTINLSSLPSGLYICSLTSHQGRIARKFVVR